MTPLLQLRNLTKTFRHLQAVKDVSLTLHKGETLAIVGESGCGKSTLTRLILGALPPTTGTIHLDATPLPRWPRKALARRIQLVFQDPYAALNPARRIGPALMQPLAIHHLPNREPQARAMLDKVGLPRTTFDSLPAQLSGGQRQRAVIARALMLRPDILVCDEPTSALDVSVQAQILNLLLDLRQEFDLTTILVSHNLGVVEHMATRVAVMYLGRIVEQDSTANIFQSPRHPYTASLLASVLTVDPGAGIPATRLHGPMPDPTAPPPGCRFHPRCPIAIPRCTTEPPPRDTDGAALVECHLAGTQTP